MKVKIETSLGDIVLSLYDETPLHRDNFVKLVREGYYDGTLFHRVIKSFMIQGGDPDSREKRPGAQYGVGGPGYTIPAEIQQGLYHKRGALAAARQGDEVNPQRASSGSQFYIVWGQVYNPGQLTQLEKQLEQAATQQVFDTLAQQMRSEIMTLRRNRDQAGLQLLQEHLISEARTKVQSQAPFLTPEQRELYTTVGGTPHLDQQYTVFGEVIEGLEVVEKIQSVETLRGDRPKQDVEIRAILLD